MAEPGLVLLGFLVAAPPLAYLALARGAERLRPEPRRALLARFLFGAVVAVGISLAAGTVAVLALGGRTLVASVAVAPVVEECSKLLGLRGARRHLDEPEDGIVLGAAVGLGFALSENVLYALRAFVESGVAASAFTTVLRGVSSTLLHAVTGAILGHMYARRHLLRSAGLQRGGWGLALALVSAVALHASFNTLVQLPAEWLWAGFVVAAGGCAALAVGLWRHARRLDARPGAIAA